eukprot:3697371-Pleurochrysis_carterae.AAC.1
MLLSLVCPQVIATGLRVSDFFPYWDVVRISKHSAQQVALFGLAQPGARTRLLPDSYRRICCWRPIVYLLVAGCLCASEAGALSNALPSQVEVQGADGQTTLAFDMVQQLVCSQAA